MYLKALRLLLACEYLTEQDKTILQQHYENLAHAIKEQDLQSLLNLTMLFIMDRVESQSIINSNQKGRMD